MEINISSESREKILIRKKMKIVDDSDLIENLITIKGNSLILSTTINNEKYNLVYEKKILKKNRKELHLSPKILI